MSDSNFGWELLLHSAQDQITNKNDFLIVFVHFCLLKQNFRNVGIGDDRTLTPADLETASECLPAGWNQMEDVYKLRYANEGKIYILNALPSEGLMIINLLNGENLTLSNVAFNVNETVVDPKKGTMKDFKGSVEKLKTELLEPVYKGGAAQRGAETQTEERRRSPPPHRPASSPLINPILNPYPRNIIPSVGGSDLDPLGRLGSGNLFQPPTFHPYPGRGGMGSGIPGARFDPFGPPVGGRPRFEPDPDHERPPGYDDMFM